MKKAPQIFFSVLSAVALVLASATGAAGFGEVDTSTKPADPSFGFTIQDDTFTGYGGYSSISGPARGGFTTNLECSSVDDSKCSTADNLRVSAILPPCGTNSLTTDICIKSLRTADSSGVMQNATLQFEANTNKFAKNEKYSLPAGGGTSVWRGASSKGGTLDYAVAIDLEINWSRTAQGTLGNSWVVGYSAQVIPVKIKTGNYFPVYWVTDDHGMMAASPQLPAGVTTYDNWSDCILVDLGRCAVRDTFHADQRIELSIQMDNAVTGWIFGRMKDTQVSATPLAKNTTLLTIAGSSINVPNGLSWVPLSAIKDSPGLQEMDWDQQLSNNKYVGPGNSVIGYPSNHPNLFRFSPFGVPAENGGGTHVPNPALQGSGMFQAVEPWLKTVMDVPTWRFQGMDPASFWGMDASSANKIWSCTVNDKTKLHGVMTTNAMAYSWAPPALVDGSLTYKVAGAHTDVDGTVFKGSYDLSMNIDSAKCIYGFTDAPIQATVSVVKADGATTEIASEIVSVKDNWLNLSAKGFTFSAPQIRIKLTQEAIKPSPNATPSPSTTQSGTTSTTKPITATQAAKKTTIKCVKGKSAKSVTAVSPKCPSGYKKK